MNRSKKFLYNTVTSAMYQIIVFIVGIILPRVMLVHYGSEINGLVSSITQMITYLSLVEAGISSATVYALYKPLSTEDYPAISRIVSAAKKFYYQSGALFVGLVVIMAGIYAVSVKVTDLPPLWIGVLVIILGASGYLDFFTLAKYRAILTADQRSYAISLASIVYLVTNTAIIAILARFDINIVLVRFVAIFSICLRSLILNIYVKRKYPLIDYKAEPNIDALNKRYSALYMQILGAVQKGSPVLLATIFTTLESVSVFSIFNMVFTGIGSLFDIFMSGLSAGFGEIIARKETKTLQKAYGDFEFVYYAMITTVYATAFVMLMPFISVYTSGVTDTDYNRVLLGVLFVVNGFLYNLKTPQGMLVISAGLYKETRVQTTIQCGLIVILGIILAPLMGLEGIMIALCISNLYRVIDLVMYIPKAVTKLPVSSTLSKIIFSIVSAAISVLISSRFNLKATGYVQWVLKAGAVFALSISVYIGVSLLFMRSSFSSAFKRIMSMIIHK